MRRSVSAVLVLASFIAGCSGTLPDAHRSAPRLPPGIEREQGHLHANWQSAENTCSAEEKRLAETAHRSAVNRHVAEVVLAATAGALALGAAVYTARADPPNANVTVPLTAAAAAAATPLVVLLVDEPHRSSALVGHRKLVDDRRQTAQAAYRALLVARRDRERAEAGIAAVEATLSKARIEDVRQRLRGLGPSIDHVEKEIADARDKPAPQGGGKPAAAAGPRDVDLALKALRAREAGERVAAEFDAARAAMVARAEGDLASAKRREHEAVDQLDDALQRLGHACGHAAK